MLDDDATSLCDRRDELEKQLQAYKDMVEELLSEKAAYSSSSSTSSTDAKPTASAPKRPARAAPKNKGHEIVALDLPARRALTKAARVLRENDDVYAISPAAPSPANATQAKYVYVKGSVDHVETPFVYIKVFPECIIEGANNPPDIRVFDRHSVFCNEAYAREAIVSLNADGTPSAYCCETGCRCPPVGDVPIPTTPGNHSRLTSLAIQAVSSWHPLPFVCEQLRHR